MINERVKSLIRHMLTAAGVVVGMLGLDMWVDIVDFIQTDLDTVLGAISTLVGFITSLLAFFANGDRFDKVEKAGGSELLGAVKKK